MKRYPDPITSPEIVRQVCADYATKRQERVAILTLDASGRLVRRRVVSLGTANSAAVHARDVFYGAIRDNAVSIIAVHNHPSGQVTPSTEDNAMTSNLRDAGRLLGIPLRDHVIVGRLGFFSYQQAGLMTG